MDILISGSLAYDRIMDFPGRFSEHFVPGRQHGINISLTVSSLTENLGGTAGNIAYALSLLGEKPRILAAIGRDYHRYFEWLDRCGVSSKDIRVVSEELTASAYITTDLAGDQITAFNPGAMKHTSDCDLSQLDPAQTIAIIAPGNLQDMTRFARHYQQSGIYAIFDPGQSLPAWNAEALAQDLGRCKMLISNDYELEMISNRTGLALDQLLERLDTVVITKGDQGAEIVTSAGVTAVPAIPTSNVLDPTGAGDAFRGGLIKGVIQGQSMRRCVEMGTVCSHYVIQVYGTQEYRFTMAAFNAKLEEHFGPDQAG